MQRTPSGSSQHLHHLRRIEGGSGFLSTLPPAGLHGLIGPNGAGKTTAFNLLTGVYAPQSGSICLQGKPIDGLKPHLIAKAGLCRTFQNVRLFGELTVIDNVRVGCQVRHRNGIYQFGAAQRQDTSRPSVRSNSRANNLLEIFNLSSRRHEQAKNLPYGDQRRLEIARALATNPKILLLDEPAAGMNPQEKSN